MLPLIMRKHIILPKCDYTHIIRTLLIMRKFTAANLYDYTHEIYYSSLDRTVKNDTPIYCTLRSKKWG